MKNTEYYILQVNSLPGTVWNGFTLFQTFKFLQSFLEHEQLVLPRILYIFQSQTTIVIVSKYVSFLQCPQEMMHRHRKCIGIQMISIDFRLRDSLHGRQACERKRLRRTVVVRGPRQDDDGQLAHLLGEILQSRRIHQGRYRFPATGHERYIFPILASLSARE